MRFRERSMTAVHATLCGLACFGLGCASISGQDPLTFQQLNEAEARRDLGIDYLARGRTALAIRELGHAETLNPNDSTTHLWLGEAHRRKGRLADAKSHAEAAVRLDPRNQEARLNLSGLYLQLGHYPEAAEQARELALDPTYVATWQALNNLGWAQFKQGLYEDARQSFEEALKHRKHYWPSRLNLGILAETEGRNRDALAEFAKVIERSPSGVVAEANYRAGEVRIAMGDRLAAIRHFEASLVSAPEGPYSESSQEFLDILR